MPVDFLHGSGMVASGTLTNLIDQLQDVGLIIRIPDPDDRRVVLVELSTDGRRRIEDALRAHADEALTALAPLMEAERNPLIPRLRTLLSSLEKGATSRRGQSR